MIDLCISDTMNKGHIKGSASNLIALSKFGYVTKDISYRFIFNKMQ